MKELYVMTLSDSPLVAGLEKADLKALCPKPLRSRTPSSLAGLGDLTPFGVQTLNICSVNSKGLANPARGWIDQNSFRLAYSR